MIKIKINNNKTETIVVWNPCTILTRIRLTCILINVMINHKERLKTNYKIIKMEINSQTINLNKMENQINQKISMIKDDTLVMLMEIKRIITVIMKIKIKIKNFKEMANRNLTKEIK